MYVCSFLIHVPFFFQDFLGTLGEHGFYMNKTWTPGEAQIAVQHGVLMDARRWDCVAFRFSSRLLLCFVA